MPRRNTDWEYDDVDPLEGPKGDTAFLRTNYKMMGIGSSFKTVKSRFSADLIKKEALKVGFVVDVKDETPWWKVTVVGKLRTR